MTTNEPIDSPSVQGKFGWEAIVMDTLGIPVIVRSNKIRYSPVRIVEQEIIKKYGSLPQAVFNCITLKSFYVTSNEARLLNIINHYHCNNIYGDSDFYTRDVIISVADVKELLRYLNVSYKLFVEDPSRVASMFGIIKMTFEPNSSNVMLIPYITKCKLNFLNSVSTSLLSNGYPNPEFNSPISLQRTIDQIPAHHIDRQNCQTT